MVGQEAAARAELSRRVAAANQELRELQAANRDAARQAELQAKLSELAAAQADPWLNEDPTQAASALSAARVSGCRGPAAPPVGLSRRWACVSMLIVKQVLLLSCLPTHSSAAVCTVALLELMHHWRLVFFGWAGCGRCARTTGRA